MSQQYRAVEWQDAGPGHRVGERQILPEAEATAAIDAGLATGLRLLRLKTGVGPCHRGETCGWPDDVALRLISLDQAEEIPVLPAAADQGAEDKAIDRPPVDRMLHAAPNTKGARS